MKYQTNPELGPYINAFGCYLCSILEKVEKKSGYTVSFSNEDVLKIYNDSMAQGFISQESKDADGNLNGCVINDPDLVFNLAATMKGVNVRCLEVSHVDAKVLPNNNEEEILFCKRAGHDGGHFMAGTGKANPSHWQDEIEFDSWEGGSKTAELGWIDSKRILSF